VDLARVGVPESCRSPRRVKAEGSTMENSRPPAEAATGVAQELGSGPEANEGALWQCYQAVAPYLKDEPDAWPQDPERLSSCSKGE
jgi:hypothetical protein